jgi:hypothetical protein
MAVSLFKDSSHHGSFFVWEGHQLDVLGEGVSDIEYRLLLALGRFKGPKKINMYSLVLFCG